MTSIKNCGMMTPETVAVAMRTGAAYLGFVHAPGSPRHLSLETMRELIAPVRSACRTVAVLVNPDDALLREVMRIAAPELLQVHGVDSPYRIEAITALTGAPVITAIAVDASTNFNHAKFMAFPSAHILFDARHAGGGEAFDWHLLRGNAPVGKDWFLAGGLNVGNVAEAIRITQAPMVDVSSGIESARGVKSAEMITAFNQRVSAL